VVLRSACTPASGTLSHQRRLRDVSAGSFLNARSPSVNTRHPPPLNSIDTTPGIAAPACPWPRRWSAVSAPAASPAHRARPSTQRTPAAPWRREPQAALLSLQHLQHLSHQLIRQLRPPALRHRLPPPLRSRITLTGMERQLAVCHRQPVMVKVPALHAALGVWWVCLATA
jgi:hypothetical protein